ncbi:DUF4124 domain-containing protein [Noviherbaspirillum cavernae]|nr:DUF4124 domain-containing protein [Noviherbaspirillum cavernae]
MTDRTPRLLLSILLVCISAHVDATTIYRYKMPDGSTLYSQTAPRGGKQAGIVRVPPMSRAETEAQGVAKRKLEQDMARADRLAVLRSISLAAAYNDVCRASQRMQTARYAYMHGLVPGPGERQGTVGRFNRLNEAYWERIRDLQQEIDLSELDLDRARTEYERLK